MARPRIRQETGHDAGFIRAVHMAAFKQSAEADLVDSLRAGGFGKVSLVAVTSETGGAKFHGAPTKTVVGHVLFSELKIIGAQVAASALALAPVGVEPAHQRRGIGSALISAGLAASRLAGYGAVFVLGEPRFYSRFSFSVELAARFDCVYACDALMALELDPHALPTSGRIEYAPPFAAL